MLTKHSDHTISLYTVSGNTITYRARRGVSEEPNSVCFLYSASSSIHYVLIATTAKKLESNLSLLQK